MTSSQEKPEGAGPTQKARGFGAALRWALVMNWGRQGGASFIALILAAILGPEAFGIMSLAMVYLLFLQILLDQGLSGALIHSERLSHERLSTAFWIVVTTGLALVGVSIALSEWWAGVNRTPELAPVIRVLSLSLVFQGLTIVQQAVLEKEMDYRSLAVRGNIAVVVGGIPGVALAFGGAGVWALVTQNLTTAFVELVLLWKLSAWRPGFVFSRAEAADLYHFSGRVFLARLGSFAHRRSDALLMGIFFGPVAVGLYRMADRLSALVIQLTTRSVAQVSLPAFAQLRSDAPALRDGVANAMKLSSIFAIPALAGLATVAAPLMRTLGDEWLDASTTIQVLCMLCMLRSLTLLTGALLQAVGRPGLLAKLTWFLAIVSISGFWVAGTQLQDSAVQDQSLSIAAIRTGVFALFYAPISIGLCLRHSSNSFRNLVRAVAPALVGAAVTSLAAWGVQLALAGYEVTDFWQLVAMVSVGGVSGLGTLYLVEPSIGVQLRVLRDRVMRQAGG